MTTITATLTERIAQDEISMRTHHVSTVHGSGTNYFSTWACILTIPTDDDDAVYLGDSEEDGALSGRVGRTMVVEYTTAGHPDEGSRLQVSDVLNGLLSNASRLEEYPTAIEWITSDAEQGVTMTVERIAQAAADHAEIAVETTKLRRFLGDAFEDYMHRTDIDV